MKKSTRSILRDYGLTILSAVVIAFFLRTYVIEAYRISNFLMKPTLLAGDTLFVEKWPFSFKKGLPERGDVVVYSGTLKNSPGSSDFIRRVIGLPGDEVAIKGGHVILNGKLLSPKWPDDSMKDSEVLPNGRDFSISVPPPLMQNFGPERVAEGMVFVLGDCRTQLEGKQKKNWSMVPIAALKGKALWIWLSVDTPSGDSPWLPHFRLNRMFRRIL